MCTKLRLTEQRRATITTNVISTFMLAHMLLPILLRTSEAYPELIPRMTFVGSALHKFATLKARKESSILGALTQLSATDTSEQDMRYNDSKLLLMLYAQKLSAAVPVSSQTGKPKVCVNVVNPGYCVSNLVVPNGSGQRLMEKFLARTTDEGARTLVDAIASENASESHGAYRDDMQVRQ